MARRRGFGEVERRVSRSGEVTYRARYAMADGTRYSRTLATKMDAEAWLAAERALIDRDSWSPPRARQAAEERSQREATFNTVGGFAERYLSERSLRPNTVSGYRQLLDSRILPTFRDTPLVEVTLADIKSWRAAMDPNTEATNAAAYRLLRSLLQAAEEEELIGRAPPKIRGASTARVKRVAKPATFDELAIIIENMPERLRLFVVLAAFVGLREGEALELRRSDVDGRIGRIDVSRKVDKNANRGAHGACRDCGRPITAPKTASGIRTVHVPPPFLQMLQKHLLEHTALGPDRVALPGRPHGPHERPFPDGPLSARPRCGGTTGPHDPPPPPHGLDHRRSAWRDRGRTPGPRRPRFTGRDGALSACHARQGQVARREDRRDLRQLESHTPMTHVCITMSCAGTSVCQSHNYA